MANYSCTGDESDVDRVTQRDSTPWRHLELWLYGVEVSAPVRRCPVLSTTKQQTAKQNRFMFPVFYFKIGDIQRNLFFSQGKLGKSNFHVSLQLWTFCHERPTDSPPALTPFVCIPSLLAWPTEKLSAIVWIYPLFRKILTAGRQNFLFWTYLYGYFPLATHTISKFALDVSVTWR